MHVLLATWAASNGSVTMAFPAENPDFQLRLTISSLVHDGDGDSRFDPREALGWCGEVVSCGYTEEVVDGLLVHVGRCWRGRTDELDLRDELIAEISEQGAQVEWSGDYFRGIENVSAMAVTLGPCGDVWSRECSLQDGVGSGRSGTIVQDLNGVLSIRFDRTQPPVRTLWPVCWGERRYLIEAVRLDEFMRQARAGVEPRESIYGAFLMRNGDETRPVEGEPLLACIGH